MTRKLTIGIAMLALVAFCGVNATAEDVEGPTEGPVGVNYTESGGMGQLLIVGAAGLSLEAYSVNGMPVAAGVVNDSYASVMVQGSGGLHLRVGNHFFDCSTDPDWNWD